MRWLNLAAYKPSAGAGVASTPIDNAFQAIQDALNGATVAGGPVASGATIPVTNPVHAITGTVTIANISDANSPTQGETVTLWIQNGLTIQNNGGGTGNIRTKTGNDRVLVANEIVTFMYDGAVWREEGPGIGGAITATKASQLGTGFDGAMARLRVMPATFNNGGATALPAATLTVGDTTGLATAGTVDCGANGIVTYTGKTATTLTGCTGGTGTLAANATIVQAAITTGPAFIDDLLLVYDAVLGKWVSAVAQSTAVGAELGVWGNAVSIASTWVELVSGAGAFALAPSLPWRAYDAAGLKPQVRVHGQLSGAGAGAQTNAKIRVHFRGKNLGDNAATPTDNAADVNSASNVVGSLVGGQGAEVVTSWADIPAGYAVKDALVISLDGFVTATAGNGLTMNTVGVDVRWIA